MLQPTSPHRRTTLPIPIDRSGFTGSQQYNASGSTFRYTFLYHSSAASLAVANSHWRKSVLSSLPTKAGAPGKRFPVPTLSFAFSPAEDRALAAENLIFSCFVRKNG